MKITILILMVDTACYLHKKHTQHGLNDKYIFTNYDVYVDSEQCPPG